MNLFRTLAVLTAILTIGPTSYTNAQTSAGPAQSAISGQIYSLGNRTIVAKWHVAAGRLADLTLTDRQNSKTISLSGPFTILLGKQGMVNAADMHIVGTPTFHELKGIADASRESDRLNGQEFEAVLDDEKKDLRVNYKIVLRDGSFYMRQLVTLSAPLHDLPITNVRLIDVCEPGIQVKGIVAGSPLVAGDFFFGFEHPLSVSQVRQDQGTSDLERTLPLAVGQSITYSSVVGVTPEGQLRRTFLAYLERERAHPYRTFLHYNSWYDAGYFTPYDESLALDRINTFGRELHEKRGVVLNSFLFDDGWDNHSSLWGFNQGFPNGFSSIRDAAAKYGFAPGVWMSPWGGYSKPKQERIAFGQKEGFEIVGNGYALSGPKYYDHFRDVCLEMIRKYGVNQFKFDGTGNVDHVFPGSRFDSDFGAMIHLIGELRQEKPDIYINLTTGTDASPFWLLYSDSIWRGGEDDDLAGVGTNRQRWITYRDADTYKRIVLRGPLYPLNSLMLHGIIYAQYNKRLNTDPAGDFADEVHSYFGSGTQLQEMYITPSLLSEKNWDTLSETAKWSRENAEVLKDTHWVGGDPIWLQVYGWASWNPKKGILVLRNPSEKAATIDIDLARVFELPSGAPMVYSAKSPWHTDESTAPIILNANKPHRFTLKPFEVLTLDLLPKYD